MSSKYKYSQVPVSAERKARLVTALRSVGGGIESPNGIGLTTKLAELTKSASVAVLNHVINAAARDGMVAVVRKGKRTHKVALTPMTLGSQDYKPLVLDLKQKPRRKVTRRPKAVTVSTTGQPSPEAIAEALLRKVLAKASQPPVISGDLRNSTITAFETRIEAKDKKIESLEAQVGVLREQLRASEAKLTGAISKNQELLKSNSGGTASNGSGVTLRERLTPAEVAALDALVTP